MRIVSPPLQDARAVSRVLKTNFEGSSVSAESTILGLFDASGLVLVMDGRGLEI